MIPWLLNKNIYIDTCAMITIVQGSITIIFSVPSYVTNLCYNKSSDDTSEHRIPGAIWSIRHLTDTLAFKDHRPHDLHDLAERRLTLVARPCRCKWRIICIVCNWKIEEKRRTNQPSKTIKLRRFQGSSILYVRKDQPPPPCTHVVVRTHWLASPPPPLVCAY